MSRFKAGDRVKLTDRFVATLATSKRTRKDWDVRRGSIAYDTAYGHTVSVIWDGNKRPDQLPIAAVEFAE